jgi:hypothetical protein
MCDYSLEAYRSRPARQGEHYTTHRFPSGTIGFITPGDPVTAICMAYDTKLTLEEIPQTTQTALDVGAREAVIFSRLENSLFQDGVRFENGAKVSLQRLGRGVKARVEDALLTPHLHRVRERETV